MQKKQITDRQLHLAYEKARGISVAYDTWIDTKAYLKRAMVDITLQNVTVLGKLKQIVGNSAIPPLEYFAVISTINYYTGFLSESMSGQNFLVFMHEAKIKPNDACLYRWFKKCGFTFSRNKIYKKDVLTEVLFRAIVWQYKQNKKSVKQLN